MYSALIFATALVCGGGIVLALTRRDSLHPLIIMLPMFAYLYVYMPGLLLRDGSINDRFSSSELIFVQLINIAALAAFIAGSMLLPRGRRMVRAPKPPPIVLHGGCALLALIGFSGWAAGLRNVGGFAAAYDNSYGGGWSDYGYVRDMPYLLLSAAILILVFESGGAVRRSRVAIAILLGSPWAIQGILGARRGPTFMVVISLSIAWFLGRRTMPRFVVLIPGGLLVGLLMLLLVTNRQRIHLGSDESLALDVSSYSSHNDLANEYIYGASIILDASQSKHYYWGRRYLAQIVVRPVPRQLWPNKYADFGVPELEFNAGTAAASASLARTAIRGSAPGMIADLWLEFSWFSIPVMFLCGRMYGFCWARARGSGGVWAAQYVVLIALSIFFVMQTGEAVIFRCVIMSLPIWIICKTKIRGSSAVRQAWMRPALADSRAPDSHAWTAPR